MQLAHYFSLAEIAFIQGPPQAPGPSRGPPLARRVPGLSTAGHTESVCSHVCLIHAGTPTPGLAPTRNRYVSKSVSVYLI